MAHQIMENNKPLFASVPAWHGLGTVIPDAFALSDETVPEFLQLSGLDWRVLESETLTASGTAKMPDGTSLDFSSDAPLHKALIRSDTQDVLGVVGRGYRVIQNKGLARFMGTIAASDTVAIESAGSIQNGRRVWIAARTSSFAAGHLDDTIQPYLMLTNRHDGRGPFIAKLTTIRPVCWNTLTLALAQNTPEYRIRHTKNADQYVVEASQVLGLATASIAAAQTRIEALSSREIGSADLSKFFLSVFERLHGPVNPNPTNASESRRHANAVDAVATMHTRFDLERTQLAGSSANMWLAMNAATNYTQNNRLRKDPETNFESLLFASRDSNTSTIESLALATL